METLLAIIFIIFGVLQIILFFKIWGMTNDVRSIKNMHQKSRDEEKKSSTEQKQDIRIGDKFKEGDLVVILRNEKQFRITEIIREKGVVYYSSGSINEKYTQNDLEHFDIYWKK